jgi:PAS domain S-box-containing protein
MELEGAVAVDVRAPESARDRLAAFALDHASDAVFWHDVDGRFEYANEAAARLFGYSREALIAKSVPDLDPTVTVATWRSKLKEVLAGGRRFESSGKDAAGRVFPIEVNVNRLTVDRRELFCVFVRDLSERKKLEEQFQQAQKMEAVGRLAGGVAHDFNNLLTIINGYSDILLSRGGLAEADAPLVREIYEAGERAAGLTRQLLTFSRRHLVQPVAMDLNALLDNMEKMLRRLIGEDVRVEFRKDAALGRIKADPGQIEQAIMNLAVNARDAMPRGGTLAVETSNAPAEEMRRLETLGLPSGRYVRLKISDTGTGMDARTLARLFEPFFTTKDPGKGTGLGLSTVYGIVRSLGGQITCASRLGEGTTFTIYVPQCGEAAPAAAGGSDAARPGCEHVLVVEDDPCVRMTLRTILEKYGYQAEVFESADAVTRRPKTPAPKLVLSDWLMPGMGGREFAAWVKAAWPEVPLLLISGYTDQEIPQASEGLADGFLQKPFMPAALARKVRDALDRAAAGKMPA